MEEIDKKKNYLFSINKVTEYEAIELCNDVKFP